MGRMGGHVSERNEQTQRAAILPGMLRPGNNDPFPVRLAAILN